MMPGSFHGTRTIGVPPASSIAWIIAADVEVVDHAVLRVDAHVVDGLPSGDLGADESGDGEPEAQRLVPGRPFLAQRHDASLSGRRLDDGCRASGQYSQRVVDRVLVEPATAGRPSPTRCAASRSRHVGRAADGRPAAARGRSRRGRRPAGDRRRAPRAEHRGRRAGRVRSSRGTTRAACGRVHRHRSCRSSTVAAGAWSETTSDIASSSCRPTRSTPSHGRLGDARIGRDHPHAERLGRNRDAARDPADTDEARALDRRARGPAPAAHP